MNNAATAEVSYTHWLVITPSVDQNGWVEAAHAAAREAGWLVVPEHEADSATTGPGRLVIVDDAQRAIASGAARIAAIVSEPESAYEALAEFQGIAAPESAWHASTLLGRALSLAPAHRVVTAVELAAKPAEILLFETLRVRPPVSRAEFPRQPLLATAFKLYRDLAANQTDAVEWSEQLFNYCPRAIQASAIPGVLDTTGRPRMLVHGPYFAMPVGRWRANLRFGVDKDAAKHQFRLDWGTRTETVSEYVTPQAPGLYELALEFDWTQVDAAEVRLILTEGCFNGTLVFQGVTVSRVA